MVRLIDVRQLSIESTPSISSNNEVTGFVAKTLNGAIGLASDLAVSLIALIGAIKSSQSCYSVKMTWQGHFCLALIVAHEFGLCLQPLVNGCSVSSLYTFPVKGLGSAFSTRCDVILS